MDLSKANKIKAHLFFLISLTLIFCTTPQPLRLSISGGLSSKLSWFFIFIGIFYTCIVFKKDSLKKQYQGLIVLKYTVVYFTLLLISLIAGLYNYPFFDKIINAPVIQFDKAPIIYNFFIHHGIDINIYQFISGWMVLHPIKNLILETVYTVGASYMIYIWFKNDRNDCLQILLKSTLIAVVLILAYCIVEIPYMYNQNNFCKWILIMINPVLHDIKDGGTWWPPLLWPDLRLRSLFAEPSYFGIYSAFAMPLIWYLYFTSYGKIKKYFLLFIIFSFSFCLFLTNSRTAFAVFLGEICLLLLSLSVFKAIYLKKMIGVISITIIAFLCATAFLGNFNSLSNKSSNKSKDQIENYLNDNLASIQSKDKKSNKARFSIMKANLNIGLDHPLIGVGISLRQGYTIQYLPSEAFDDGEVKMWIDNQKRKGIIKSGFPSLGEYTTRFAETGALGLIVFILPALYLTFYCLRKICINSETIEEKTIFVFFLISFLGVLATGIGESLNVTYCYWILLGVGFVLCNPNKDKKENYKCIKEK